MRSTLATCFELDRLTVMVRQPRMPCYKLALKFQRDDILERFLLSGRSGVYFSVEREGEVGEGDSIELVEQNLSGITIAEMNRLVRPGEIQSRVAAEGDSHGCFAGELAGIFSA